MIFSPGLHEASAQCIVCSSLVRHFHQVFIGIFPGLGQVQPSQDAVDGVGVQNLDELGLGKFCD